MITRAVRRGSYVCFVAVRISLIVCGVRDQ